MYSDLQYLKVDLPEDIAKLKACGMFEQMDRVIEKRLQKNIPLALRKRLELERVILSRIPGQYPYTFDDAVKLLSDNFNDFTPEELQTLWEDDAVEWYFINGKVHFKDDIAENLAKVRPAYSVRAKNPQGLKDKEGNFTMLSTIINTMKENGSATCRIHMRTTMQIKEGAVAEGETLRVHLPIPKEYAQVKNFTLLKTLPEATLVGKPDYEHRTVYFETPYKKGQDFLVEYIFDNCSVYQNPQPEDVLDAQPTFYTEELAPHIMFTPYMRSLATEIVGDEKNPLIKARKIYDFVTTNVMYSFVRPYITITDIPSYAATSLKGDCGIQALLFITLCRVCGVPARWQSGLYANPRSVGNHDWAQYYVAPFGWLFADCSFGGSAWREGATDRWNFYACNLEPYRIPANSSFQHELFPPKKYIRLDPYDNQTGEAETDARGLNDDEFTTTHVVVEITEV